MNPDAGLEDLMRDAARVNEVVSGMRGQGESAGGRVRIEVTPDGAISNLYLDEEVQKMPAHELSRAIRDAQRSAIVSITQSIKDIQSEVTENPYITTILRATMDNEPQPARTTLSQPVSSSRQAAGGMTTEELDASQEQFNLDPLGRRPRR